ncbi:MAG: FecR domain-containing protein [Muribaculaceae bacterium]|nr:FecR domain-containing protein [Muribaculaceae bacterium]
MVEISEELIARFINNSCTDDELLAVKQWLDESAGNAAQLFETEYVSDMVGTMRHASAIRKNISAKIERRMELERKKRQRRGAVRWIAGVAAMIAVVVTIGVTLFMRPDVKTISVYALSSCEKVVLPDSTVVYLNRNSVLSYPETFASRSREVTLDGEAFFEVKKDSEHPFVVTGQYLSVEVTGTKFDFVSRDHEDSSVSLLEGGVEVSPVNRNEGVLLVPGQRVSYSIESGKLSVTETNAAIDAAWHDRIIPFENANIGQICDILVQLYDTPIEVSPGVDPVKTYSGATVYYEKLDSTLKHLCHTIPVEFSERDGHIVISPK